MEGEAWPIKRKISNLASSEAAARQRRKLRSTAEAEAEALLAKSTRSDDNPDRISDLPDSVLHHILSFLDMKHVIHTAFLSKRWITIFKSLPTLSLNQVSYEKIRHGNDVKFIDFVDKVLCLREAAADDADNNNNDIIQSLHISCFHRKMDTITRNHVNTWIDFAVRHNVQELDFELALKEYLYNGLLPLPEHPLSLFSCKLLTTLSLASNNSQVMIPHDLVVDLPKLKTLHLHSLRFHGEKISDNFFSRCPLLETLVITHCILVNSTLNIVVSEDHQLKYLKIEYLCKLGKYSELDKILQWLPSFRTIISAPKLTSLLIRDHVNDEVFGDYNIVNTVSLVKARMDSYLNARNLIKFFNSISDVKSLTLFAVLLQGHKHSVGIHACLKDLLTPFRNLRVLKLLMDTSFERDQIRAIAYLLEKCPNVETLALKMMFAVEQPTTVDKECGKAELSSLKFKLDHLKFIKIQGFTGRWNELEFLKFMLMHTPVLEKMVIYAYKNRLSTQDQEIYRAMLEASPRVSSKTEFLFLEGGEFRWPRACVTIRKRLD